MQHYEDTARSNAGEYSLVFIVNDCYLQKKKREL